jgi:DNA-3-methyladenine glycosylase I
MPAANGLSDRIGKDLKRRGFKYLGSVTVYSYLQACGIINDHEESCFRYEDILEHYPTVKKRKDAER